MSDTKLRSSVYQKKLKSSGNFAPQTSSQLRCYLRMARRPPPSKCWATAAGAERLAARVWARGQILRGLGGPGEVTSPLFSINSILNANWYYISIMMRSGFSTQSLIVRRKATACLPSIIR